MIDTMSSSAPPQLDADAFLRSLVEAHELGEADAHLAMEVSRQHGQTPVRAVVELGLLSEDVLADRLAQACKCSRWKLADAADRVISDVAPAEFMAANNVLILESADDFDATDSAAVRTETVQLVVADPSDHHVIRSLVGQMEREFIFAIGTQKDIQEQLKESRRSDEETAGASEERLDVAAEVSQLRDLASEAPVIRFFNQAIERATELGASDVHLERFDRHVSLRMRVDGMLIEQPAPPLALYEALLCRIKIMAELDIAQRRQAQDGRIRMRLRGRMVDMRVSIVPTLYGQDAVLRVQDRQKLGEIVLRDLGFTEDQESWLVDTAAQSHGILLITGPTGSGKTTTLYALLRRLVNIERKIITVEDPVEYAMDGVNQIQVNASIGLTFSTMLRNVLRHDPDVILIGEIRDAETAQMAFQAALTGHMVLSTLHTNDVPGTFVRLIDMGVEPYLVNAVVEGVTAQRLVRMVCKSCKNDHEARRTCDVCKGLGYKGRIALMERSGMPASVKRALVKGADEHTLRDLLVKDGFRTTRHHADELIAQGVTDEAEILRVLGANRAIDDEL